MNRNYFLWLIVSLIIFIFTTGCSSSNAQSKSPLTITNGKAVLIPDGKGGRNITFWVSVKNDQYKKSEPFYVEFDVKDKWLSLQLKKHKIIVGDWIVGRGNPFTVKANCTFGIGGTYKISSPVDENKLKTAVEKNKAVEVRLLTNNNKLITKGFITKYGKDLTKNGVNDANSQ